MTNQNKRPLPPAPLRWGGVIAIAQSILVLCFAAFLIYRDVTDAEQTSLISENSNIGWVGTGTAIYLLIIFGAIIAAAISMMRGRKWGRGPVAMWELILLPISYYMFSEGAALAGALSAVSAIAALACLFNRQSVEWAAASYGR
ncbi:hypothetical protein CATRI_03070 [Corynebacterium atrinae]|uniref:hypothetical protein n=1 Tax=Corynebacterium atrinae TaxID=1336740 RepID=UPI0025B61E48|nr:hypothetical protein [Corynebacterium atrinae]WJY62719.1 hypothetical protein CATRI_03070 [Corynebacterium atrinae]